MTWPTAASLVATLLSAAFLLAVADDPRFFNFSRTASRWLGNVVAGLVVSSALVLALATATIIMSL